MPRPSSCSVGLATCRTTALFCCLLATATATAEGPTHSFSKMFPAQGLTFYLEYDGLDAHAEAWKATAAYDVLGRTTAGATVADVARRTLDHISKNVNDDAARGADLVALQDRITHQGFGFAAYYRDGNIFTVYALKGFDGKEDHDRFDRLLWLLLDPRSGQPLSTPLELRGRKLSEFRREKDPAARFSFNTPQAGPTWWFEGETLVLVQGPTGRMVEEIQDPEKSRKQLAESHKASVEAVLDAIEGKKPNASTHPGVIAAISEGLDLGGFTPSGLFIAESVNGDGVLDGLRAWTSLTRGSAGELDISETLGLNRSKRIIGRWGFRGKALLTDVRFEAAGPWNGFVGMLKRPGFPKARFPDVVRGPGSIGVGSFGAGLDPESLALLRPALIDDVRLYALAAEEVFKDSKNHQVLMDLFSVLGPAWSVRFDSPQAILVEFKDRPAMEVKLDAAASRINAYFCEQDLGEDALAKPGDAPPAMVLEPLPAPERGYRLTSPGNRVSWLTEQLQPTILIKDSFLVVALNPDSARKAAAEAPPKPTGELAKSLDCLPANLSLLLIGNPRNSFWPDCLANFRSSTASFFSLKEADEPQPAQSDVLNILGVKPRAKVGPGQSPKADVVRSSIFPSVIAAAIDNRGVRVVSLEALPLGCVALKITGKAGGPITIGTP